MRAIGLNDRVAAAGILKKTGFPAREGLCPIWRDFISQDSPSFTLIRQPPFSDRAREHEQIT
jgi:hypothetical protein